MEERSEGLILRTRPLTETSLIVSWLSPELGRLSTVAKGARRPKSSFAGKLDLFYVADFSFRRSHRSELHALIEVNVKDFHLELRRDLSALQKACYFAQLLELTTEKETPLPRFYEIVCHALNRLRRAPSEVSHVFTFEMEILTELGLSPSLEENRMSPESRRFLESWGDSSPPNEPPLPLEISLTRGQTQEIQKFLHGFLIYHLGKIPAGRTAALGV